MSKSLVNPNKNWGWFSSDMQPLATGDNWHKLPCPKPQYRYMEVDLCYYEGTTTQELQEEKCPINSVSPKKDICSRCGNIFIYP